MFCTTVTWDEIKQRIKKNNRPFYQLVEEYMPNANQYPLFLARYPYGQMITVKGQVHLPDAHGVSVDMASSTVSLKTQKALSYATTPLMLQLEQTAEAFIDAKNRTIPLNLFSPGDFFGLFEAVECFTGCRAYPAWSVSSGARSHFLMAPVSNKHGHQRLQRAFRIESPAPQTLYAQWGVFKGIAQREYSHAPWHTEVLLFSRQWFQPKNPGHQHLQNFLLKACWVQAELLRRKYEFNAYWEALAPTIRALKPNTYLMDTTKHLLHIFSRFIPGFQMTLSDEDAFPAQLIERAYIDVYQLPGYAPVMVTPSKTSSQGALFYSMSYPTLLEGSPAMQRRRSFRSELRNIAGLLSGFCQEFQQEAFLPYQGLTSDVFSFYHTGTQTDPTLHAATTLAHDPKLIALQQQYYPGRMFPAHSPFLYGAVKIETPVGEGDSE